jgi:hypothetical protein
LESPHTNCLPRMSSSSGIGGTHRISPYHRSNRYLFALPGVVEHHSSGSHPRRPCPHSRESSDPDCRTQRFRRCCQCYVFVHPSRPRECRYRAQRSSGPYEYWRNGDLLHHRRDWPFGFWSWQIVSGSTGVESGSWRHRLLRPHAELQVSISPRYVEGWTHIQETDWYLKSA